MQLDRRERIAVIGGGISGLGAAWLLAQAKADVTLFEARRRMGGHSNTVLVEGASGPVPVDTGFIVYNERNYPLLTSLFAWLRVPTQASDMSFAVSVRDASDRAVLEYAGDNLNTLFAQRSNVFSRRHWQMLLEVLRFNRETRAALALGSLAQGSLAGLSLGDFLHRGGYSESFRHHYLLPMGGAIWSCPMRAMLDFPAASFVRFFENHGLLSVNDRPRWRTVTGGSREYVARLLDDFPGDVFSGLPVARIRRVKGGVDVIDASGHSQRFDRVVLACHADEALALLESPSAAERDILGAFRFQANTAVLHSDESLLPQRRLAWSSWNYLAEAQGFDDARVSVSYWMNRLQSLPAGQNWLVSLNPLREPDAGKIHYRAEYMHPVFDTSALAAQQRLHEIQGPQVFYAGAWQGYGFHEDGFRSAVDVAARLGVSPPWNLTDDIPNWQEAVLDAAG